MTIEERIQQGKGEEDKDFVEFYLGLLYVEFI